jgi:hypothetical protein
MESPTHILQHRMLCYKNQPIVAPKGAQSFDKMSFDNSKAASVDHWTSPLDSGFFAPEPRLAAAQSEANDDLLCCVELQRHSKPRLN